MVATIIAAGAALLGGGAAAVAISTFAVNFAVSYVVGRIFAPNDPTANQPVDQGVRQQVAPNTTNSLPIVYGNAYMGGTFVDAVLTIDQQSMYYVLAISSISPNGQFTFDRTKFYYGDRLVTFDASDLTKVVSLTDGAGNVDTKINGYLYINLYTSTDAGAITTITGSAPNTAMGGADIIAAERWPAAVRQMNGLAFAIVKLNYNQDAGTTNLQAITFNVTQNLNGTGAAKPGDVWADYLGNEVYGGGMAAGLISTASATALNTYADQTITFTDSSGNPATQARYRINGVLDTGQNVLANIDRIMLACDSWNAYNAASGQWSIVINKAESTAYAFDDTNIIGDIKVSLTDITSSINQIEAQFPNKLNRDQRDLVYLETPSNLLYANEPINKFSCNFDLINESVQVSYLANRVLEQAREDLIVGINAAYPAIQLDAGDVVSITNTSYGWSAKLFRVMKVSEVSLPDGNLGASLELNEYNAAVYDNATIVQYSPAPNTQITDPSFFGVVPAPTVTASYPSAAVPTITVQPYVGTASFVTVAEIWYSAFASPTPSQLYLLGFTQVPSNGVPISPNQSLPTISATLPGGNWYLFSRLVNGIATSAYSVASTVLQWRPTTFQYTERYINVRYGNDLVGTGFTTDPRNKAYYGLQNTPSTTGSPNASDYTWYLASSNFSTNLYLLYVNRGNRKFSFAVGAASFVNISPVLVPTDTSVYDSTLWLGLQDGINSIDLDARTGQLTVVGTPATSVQDGLINVTNNPNGTMVVKLDSFLNFGAGVYSKNFSVATLTIDVFGRVVGFTSPDGFFYTESTFQATAAQTTFSVTHIVGDVLVFKNGLLLDTTEYTETSTTVVLGTACTVNDTVIVINMRAVSTSVYYEDLGLFVVDNGSNFIEYLNQPYQNIVVGDILTFTNVGTPTQYTVTAFYPNTKIIEFSPSQFSSLIGLNVYRYIAASSTYRPWSRFSANVTAVTTYTPTTITIRNGFESIYVNGVQFTELDYDLDGSAIVGFPGAVTGKITIILYAPNNYGVPASNATNTLAYSVNGVLTYNFSSNPLAMEVYANGVILAKTYDYIAYGANYNLVTAIPNNFTLLNQQTFARDGAA
jgi:hypothetical protein